MGLTLEPRIVEWLIEQTGRAHPHDEPPAVCGACAVYNYLSEKWRIRAMTEDRVPTRCNATALDIQCQFPQGHPGGHWHRTVPDWPAGADEAEQPAPPLDYCPTCMGKHWVLAGHDAPQPAPPLDVEHEAVNMLRRIVAARGMAWLDDEIEGANNWLARIGSAPSRSEPDPLR